MDQADRLEKVADTQSQTGNVEANDHPLGAPAAHASGNRGNEINTKINDLFGASGGSEEVVSETGSESNLRSSNRRRDAIHVEDDLKDFEIQY